MTAPQLICTALIDELRQTYPVHRTVYLAFGECKLAVSVNRADVADALSSYFKPFLCPEGEVDIEITAHESPEQAPPVTYTVKAPDPGKRKIKEEYVELPDGRIVRKRLTGMLFVFTGAEHLAIGPCWQNLNQVINFINNRYIEWLLCKGCLLGHAAGVILDGRGVAMAGFSGAGKSTLALQLMNEGAVFVSNDRLMIEAHNGSVRMHGVAKMPRINPGTALNNPALRQVMTEEERQRFGELEAEALWDLEYKYDAPIEACYGPNRFVLSAPLNLLVLLNWRRTGEPLRVEQVDLNLRRDLLPAFMKSVGLFFLPRGTCRMPEPIAAAYAELLSTCDVWEFSGGADFAAATEACLEICKSK